MELGDNPTSTVESTVLSHRAEPTHPPHVILPDQPLVKIRPGKSWISLDLRDLWAYRELFYFLMWRDIKVRYKQTALGVSWAILQPLFTMLIFTLFFGKLAGIDSEGIPYPVFVYAGLLLWTFFANAVTAGSNSLVRDANLLSKVYFPRMLIPASAVGSGLVDLAVAFVLLIGLMIYYKVTLVWSVMMLPVLIILTVLLALGVGMWLSALNVKYRDIRFVLPFLVQLWMFVSPIIYPLSFVPQKWRWLLALNPLTGIIDAFRVSLFGHRGFDWATLGISTAITFALLLYSAYAFWRMEDNFADIV